MNTQRISILEKYIEESPEDPFNHYALAMEYYEESPSKSSEILLSLIKENPDYLPTYYKLAHLLWDEDEMDEAEEIFTSGIDLAKKQNNAKILQELISSYQNFSMENL